MRSNRPSCMAYDEQIRFESTVKIHSKLFNRSREVRYVLVLPFVCVCLNVECLCTAAVPDGCAAIGRCQLMVRPVQERDLPDARHQGQSDRQQHV